MHVQTRAWHRAHAQRYRRAWAIMGIIVLIALIYALYGYFNDVTWVELSRALVHTTYRLLLAYAVALFLGVSIALIVGWSPLS